MRMNEIISDLWFLSQRELALLDLPVIRSPSSGLLGWGLALFPGPGPRPEVHPEYVSSGQILRAERYKPGCK